MRIAPRRGSQQLVCSRAPDARRRLAAVACLFLVSIPRLGQAGPGEPSEGTFGREGAYWVRTIRGTAACQPNGRLQINARGRVVVQGAAVDKLEYSITQRVKARNEQDARRLMGGVGISTRPRGEQVTITLTTVEQPAVTSEITIKAPRGLKETSVETKLGGVQMSDLEGLAAAVTGGGQILMDRLGSNAAAKTGGGEVRIGKVGGNLKCQSGAGSIFVESARGETWCDTAGGEIVVREVGGALHAFTEGGNILVEKAWSTVTARSGEGTIDVRYASGLVTADTRGGSIQIGSANGVRCESGAGTIRLRSGAGPMWAATTVGSILAEIMAGARLQDSVLSAGAGDVTLLIPPSVAMWVQARSDVGAGMGRIVSEFPEIKVRLSESDRMRPWIGEGMLNGGGPVMRISAAGGTIYLRRQK